VLLFYSMLYVSVLYGSIWAFLIPLIVIFIMHLKIGLIFCAVFLASMVAMEIEFEVHSLEEFTRYVCIYFAQITLIVAYEALRIFNKDKLLEEKEKVEYLSITDHLTKLYNRRHFSECIEKEFARAARQGENLSFLMIDADKFKNYNDTYGHLQGDKLLVSIAGILKENIMRSSDAAFRMGGEEFGILLPNTDYQGAFLVAEKIRSEVSEMKVPLLDKDGETKITVSIGVACVKPQSGENPDALMKLADNNLYKAKEMGRNRVVS
ncbi:MAG: GGDEF domain-containing protein, partial [Candidatus Fibromonas sp.]|nr:GGDEF domain-containing protein [Candidatus Fibromonas sp.]